MSKWMCPCSIPNILNPIAFNFFLFILPSVNFERQCSWFMVRVPMPALYHTVLVLYDNVQQSERHNRYVLYAEDIDGQHPGCLFTFALS